MKKVGRTLNHRLRSQRKIHNWTQSQVAEKIGTTVVNVNRWENGNTVPSLYFRQKLCDLFGKSADELGLFTETERQEQGAAVVAPTSSTLWNVPFRRNPYFTGREEVLSRLLTALTSSRVAAVAQTQAISGLGGIGKTQTVVEYAFRHQGDYQAVLWAKADSPELLTADFVNLAALLNLPEKDEQDQSRVAAAVKRWLKDHIDWLLILDNVEDPEMVSDYLPSSYKGHVLLTTRAQSTGTVAQRIELERMGPEEGALFLLRRAKRIASDAALEQASLIDREKALELSQLLDGLPLALDQAAAYIEETDCGLSGYLSRYQTRHRKLLNLRGNSSSDHPESVAATWSLSFEKVQQTNLGAADLLRLCAFLHPDAIPEEIITDGATELNVEIQSIAFEPLDLDMTIRELRRYSLVKRTPETQMLMIHRLVQSVLKDSMDEETQRQWAERTVRAVNRTFPEVELATWHRCQRLIPHAQSSAELIAHWDLAFPEAARLLTLAGQYLLERGQYVESTLFFQRALAIKEKVLGTEHPDVAVSLDNLAVNYYYLRRFAEAEPLLQRALAINEKVLGPIHVEIAMNLDNLAILYHSQGKYAETEAFHKRALAIFEQVLGPNHQDVALNLSNLAALYNEQGRYTDAEPLLQRSLSIQEQVSGPTHPNLAHTLNHLARLYEGQGRLEQAELLWQRALSICEQNLGPKHPITVRILISLGGLYQSQRKYEEAEALLKRALSIDEQELNPPDMQRGLETYASLLRAMKRDSEALELEVRANAMKGKIM